MTKLVRWNCKYQRQNDCLLVLIHQRFRSALAACRHLHQIWCALIHFWHISPTSYNQEQTEKLVPKRVSLVCRDTLQIAKNSKTDIPIAHTNKLNYTLPPSVSVIGSFELSITPPLRVSSVISSVIYLVFYMLLHLQTTIPIWVSHCQCNY